MFEQCREAKVINAWKIMHMIIYLDETIPIGESNELAVFHIQYVFFEASNKLSDPKMFLLTITRENPFRLSNGELINLNLFRFPFWSLYSLDQNSISFSNPSLRKKNRNLGKKGYFVLGYPRIERPIIPQIFANANFRKLLLHDELCSLP